MSFKFIGKTKLLKTLKEQMDNPDIWFKDVIYTREEDFDQHKNETIVYIENNTHYQIRYEHQKDEQKTTMYYEIIKQVAPNNFKVEQKILLKEREEN